jgi:hypothetical protein
MICVLMLYINPQVYYHLDDSMPYMSEVPVPLDRLTLADFKKVFNRRKGFSYFCKEWDPHLDRFVCRFSFIYGRLLL